VGEYRGWGNIGLGGIYRNLLFQLFHCSICSIAQQAARSVGSCEAGPCVPSIIKDSGTYWYVGSAPPSPTTPFPIHPAQLSHQSILQTWVLVLVVSDVCDGGTVKVRRSDDKSEHTNPSQTSFG